MSVPNQTPYNIHTANGVATVYAYEFLLLDAADMQVSINGSVVSSGYTVNGIGNANGGDVTFITPPAQGATVMLLRDVPLYRITNYQDNGDLRATTINLDFDRIWMVLQGQDLFGSLALRRPWFNYDYYEGDGYRIADIADPKAPKDAVTKQYADKINSRVSQEIIDRKNADDALASLIGQAGQIEVPFYDSLTAASVANIKSTIRAIQTAGEKSPGDGRNGLYVRVTSEPSHNRKAQFSDGSWWELVVKDVIFILSTGQSNMQRHPEYTWAPAKNLYWWNNAQGHADSTGTKFVRPAGNVINPALSFASSIANDNPDSMVYLLNCAYGGAAISHWLPGTDEPDIYQNIVDNISPALASAGVSKIKTLLWWQGENGGSATSYPTDFESVINRFRSESWFDHATPTVIFGVTPTYRGGENRYDITNLVLQKIASLRGAYRLYVDTQSFTSDSFWDDNVHMNGPGYLSVGKLAFDNFTGKTRFTDARLSPESVGVADANFITGNGDYRTASNTLNTPTPQAGILSHCQYNDNYAIQEYTVVNTGARFRRFHRVTWQPWKAINGLVVATNGSTNQIITGNSDTRVTYGSVASDDASMFSGSTFTPPSGYWNVTASIRINAGVIAGETFTLSIRSNGSNEVAVMTFVTDSAAAVSLSLSAVLPGNGTTGYSVYVKCSNASNNKQIQGYSAATRFQAFCVDY